MYQNGEKYTYWPYHLSNGHTIYQVALKYFNSLKNQPNSDCWYSKTPSGNPDWWMFMLNWPHLPKRLTMYGQVFSFSKGTSSQILSDKFLNGARNPWRRPRPRQLQMLVNRFYRIGTGSFPSTRAARRRSSPCRCCRPCESSKTGLKTSSLKIFSL
jgi:hypothetical protein